MGNFLSGILGNKKKSSSSGTAAASATQAASSAILPATEREYYALPAYFRNQNDMQTAEGRSAANAATRGAQDMQENRINQIRARAGNAAAFNPQTDQPGLPQGGIVAPGSPTTASTLSLANNPNKPPINIHTRPALQQALGLNQDEIKQEMAQIPTTIRNRYQNDAVRAGTLTNSAQSQAALTADVNAGIGGAQKALQDNAQIASDANSQNFAQSQYLFPTNTPGTSSATPAQLPVPNAQINTAPENTLTANNNLLSAQRNPGAANRMKQIQQSRGL